MNEPFSSSGGRWHDLIIPTAMVPGEMDAGRGMGFDQLIKLDESGRGELPWGKPNAALAMPNICFDAPCQDQFFQLFWFHERAAAGVPDEVGRSVPCCTVLVNDRHAEKLSRLFGMSIGGRNKAFVNDVLGANIEHLKFQ